MDFYIKVTKGSTEDTKYFQPMSWEQMVNFPIHIKVRMKKIILPVAPHILHKYMYKQFQKEMILGFQA